MASMDNQLNSNMELCWQIFYQSGFGKSVAQHNTTKNIPIEFVNITNPLLEGGALPTINIKVVEQPEPK